MVLGTALDMLSTALDLSRATLEERSALPGGGRDGGRYPSRPYLAAPADLSDHLSLLAYPCDRPALSVQRRLQ